MSIYNRDPFTPDWEPIPYDAPDAQADEQERGFHQRATQPIPWSKLDWATFPPAGFFGQTIDWFVEHEITHIATFDGEDLVLIERAWSGFPDPPRYALASRSTSQPESRWMNWGSFPTLPRAWHNS